MYSVYLIHATIKGNRSRAESRPTPAPGPSGGGEVADQIRRGRIKDGVAAGRLLCAKQHRLSIHQFVIHYSFISFHTFSLVVNQCLHFFSCPPRI